MIHRLSWENGYINIVYNEKIEYNNYEKFHFHKNLSAKDKELPESVLISLEIERHVGPRILYGMLVMNINHVGKDKQSKLSVAYTKENTIRYDDRGSGKIIYKSRYEGLPYEYVEGIVSGVEKYIRENDDFPACDISVIHARNCEIGSSIGLYEKMIMSMLKLVFKHEIECVREINAKEFLGKFFKD